MRNVLLLGADAATVSLYRPHFDQAGVELISTEIVEPLDDFLRLAQPAAVLLDVSRIKGHGQAVLQSIRSQPEFRNLPLFALSDQPLDDHSTSSTEEKFMAFQNSPEAAPQVVSTVTAALNRLEQSVPAKPGITRRPAYHDKTPPPLPGATPQSTSDEDVAIGDNNAHLIRLPLTEGQRKLQALGEEIGAKGSHSSSSEKAAEARASNSRPFEHQAKGQGETVLLEQRLCELEACLGHERNRCERFEEENSALRKAEESFKARVLELDSEVKQLRQSLNQAVAQCDEERTGRAAAEEKLRIAVDSQERGGSSEEETKISLERQFEAMGAYHALVSELERARNQAAEERSKRQELEAGLLELQASKEELDRNLESISRAAGSQRELTQTLETKLKETTKKLATTEASLEAQSRESRRVELRCKGLDERVRDLSSQLTAQAAVEQCRCRQERELKACLQEQQNALDQAKAVLAAERSAMERAKTRIRAALGRLIQELDTQTASREEQTPALPKLEIPEAQTVSSGAVPQTV